MQLEQNRSLKTHNSFGFDIKAEYFTHVHNEEELLEALHWSRQKNIPVFILGGGSNTVFASDVRGLTIHMAIQDLSIKPDNNDSVHVRAGAGVIWHDLVRNTLSEHCYGLENLALIPGYCGAAPIQNIGAYGRELCDFTSSVETIDRTNGNKVVLSATDCDFGYRHSLFKTDSGNQLIVTAINLQLSQSDNPVLNYSALKNAASEAGITTPRAQHVFDLVCSIRRNKLPDPQVLGNAGSFFKNPVISRQQLDALTPRYANIPSFEQPNQHYKIPAAWLIDQAGWRGYRNSRVGVHNRQALVLINHGDGCGNDIASLADEIKLDIYNKFGIALDPEPVFYQ